MANSKIRVSVPLSPEIYKLTELESKKFGVSMSSFIAFILGQHLDTKLQVLNSFNSTMLDAVKKMEENEREKLTTYEHQTK